MPSCCCFLFVTVFFLCSFFACFLFSSPGLPQAAVLWGVPAPACITHGCSTFSAKAPPQHRAPPTKNHFQPHPQQSPPPCASSYICFCVPSCVSLHAPPHLLLHLLCFSLSHLPICPPERLRPLWQATFQWGKTSIKDCAGAGRKLALQVSRLLLSTCTELSIFTVVTPAPRISTNSILMRAKLKRHAALGLTIQLIRSFPHHLLTRVLQSLVLFHAKTVEKILSQIGRCTILPPCLSPPTPNIQAASEVVDGHIPQHCCPESPPPQTVALLIALSMKDCISS